MVERPPAPDGAGGIYVHIPFCSRRCSYCDFATVAGADHRVDAYLSALGLEIRRFQPGAHVEVDSVFFGGGTPSRLQADQVDAVLQELNRRFDVLPGTEITLESNPEDLTPERLDGYLRAGVNRLTVGVQSLDDAVLRSVGRGHDGAGALAAVDRARAAGFPQVAVDLIAGLPGEDTGRWSDTLTRLIRRQPNHLSVYLLETDKDTPLTRSMAAGRIPYPEDDLLAGAWDRTTDLLESAGYRQYEISNYARAGEPQAVCRHNLKYWTDRPYAGFGLGAHAYHRGERRSNHRDLERYIRDVERGIDPLEDRDPWNPVRRVEEALFMGLRLREGLDLHRLGRRYGLDLTAAYAQVWSTAEDQGLLELRSGRVRLTRPGRLRSNQVFARLLNVLPLE